MGQHPDEEHLWDKIHLSRMHQKLLKGYCYIHKQTINRAEIRWTFSNTGIGRYENGTLFVNHDSDIHKLHGAAIHLTVSHILYQHGIHPRRNLPIYQRTLSELIEVADNMELPYDLNLNLPLDPEYDHMMGDKDYPVCTLLGPNVYLKWDNTVQSNKPQTLQKDYGILALVNPEVKLWGLDQAKTLFE